MTRRPLRSSPAGCSTSSAASRRPLPNYFTGVNRLPGPRAEPPGYHRESLAPALPIRCPIVSPQHGRLVQLRSVIACLHKASHSAGIWVDFGVIGLRTSRSAGGCTAEFWSRRHWLCAGALDGQVLGARAPDPAHAVSCRIREASSRTAQCSSPLPSRIRMMWICLYAKLRPVAGRPK